MVPAFLISNSKFLLIAPIDGHWGRWSAWGSCSASCGEGNRTRTRECDDPPNLNGGQYCQGGANHTEPCLIQSCGVGKMVKKIILIINIFPVFRTSCNIYSYGSQIYWEASVQGRIHDFSLRSWGAALQNNRTLCRISCKLQSRSTKSAQGWAQLSEAKEESIVLFYFICIIFKI